MSQATTDVYPPVRSILFDLAVARLRNAEATIEQTVPRVQQPATVPSMLDTGYLGPPLPAAQPPVYAPTAAVRLQVAKAPALPVAARPHVAPQVAPQVAPVSAFSTLTLKSPPWLRDEDEFAHVLKRVSAKAGNIFHVIAFDAISEFANNVVSRNSLLRMPPVTFAEDVNRLGKQHTWSAISDLIKGMVTNPDLIITAYGRFEGSPYVVLYRYDGVFSFTDDNGYPAIYALKFIRLDSMEEAKVGPFVSRMRVLMTAMAGLARLKRSLVFSAATAEMYVKPTQPRGAQINESEENNADLTRAEANVGFTALAIIIAKLIRLRSASIEMLRDSVFQDIYVDLLKSQEHFEREARNERFL